MSEPLSDDDGSVTVGDTGPKVTVTELARKDFVRYAGASGDFNRLHYDEPYVTEAGRSSVIGQGMLTAAIASQAVTRWFGVGALQRFEIRFEDSVVPGDSVTAVGTVTQRSTNGGTAILEVEAVVKNQRGETVLTGDATVSTSVE